MRAVNLTLLRSLMLIGVAHSANGQVAEPASIDLGGLQLTPTLAIDYFVDDNLLRDEAQSLDSSGYRVLPGLSLSAEFGANSLAFYYQGERGQYQDSEADNYTDHLLGADIYYEFGEKHRIEASGAYSDSHDARGTAYSLGRAAQLSEPDRFSHSALSANYTFGAKTAPARIQVRVAHMAVDYDINTDEYRLRDRRANQVNGVFFYQVAANTDLVFDLGYQDISYDFSFTPQTSLDSSEQSLLVGAQWDVSGSTNGFVKVGYQRKSFDIDSRETFSGLTWQAGVDWTPVSYSKFSISSQLGTRETNGQSDFIRSQSINLGWQHSWLERLTTQLQLRIAKDSYEGGTVPREDDVNGAQFVLQYQFYRWLRIDIHGEHETRESDTGLINFDRNRYGVTAHFSL